MAELVPAGRSAADIGTGDGKLAAWLARRGHRVIATENKAGPREVSRRLLDPLGVECRLGEGLAPIARGEVDVAVIAGMGGRTIGRILAASPEVVAGLEALVLQPVQHREELLAQLLAAGYRRQAGIEVRQGSHLYTALLLLPPYSTAR